MPIPCPGQEQQAPPATLCRTAGPYHNPQCWQMLREAFPASLSWFLHNKEQNRKDINGKGGGPTIENC